MKAKVKLALPGFAGQMDDMIIYYNSKLNKLIARRKVTPKKVPANNDFIALGKLQKSLNLSEGYIENCRRYIDLYNQKNRRYGKAMSSWNNVFIKVMMKMKLAYPEVNFDTLTRKDIISHDYPCRTIAKAVEANLLEKVKGYENLNKEM